MKIFLLIIIAICVTAIYDARKIAEKFLSDGNINRQAKAIKLISFGALILVSIIYIIIN